MRRLCSGTAHYSGVRTLCRSCVPQRAAWHAHLPASPTRAGPVLQLHRSARPAAHLYGSGKPRWSACFALKAVTPLPCNRLWLHNITKCCTTSLYGPSPLTSIPTALGRCARGLRHGSQILFQENKRPRCPACTVYSVLCYWRALTRHRVTALPKDALLLLYYPQSPQRAPCVQPRSTPPTHQRPSSSAMFFTRSALRTTSSSCRNDMRAVLPMPSLIRL